MKTTIKTTAIMALAMAGLAGNFTFAPIKAANAHIDLISPSPLLGGRTDRGRTLKHAPFGAPDIDAAAAEAHPYKSGELIKLDLNQYVYHPGDIVVLWTRDPEGKDVMPAMTIPKMGAPIPHHNMLSGVTSPCADDTGCKVARTDIPFSMWVTLPNIEGDIYLVVRQVMHDKFDELDDGSVSLKRIYYHQTAKLHLSK